MRIRRVKRTDDKVEVHYEEMNADGGWDELAVKLGAAPAASFEAALAALPAHVVDICELGPGGVERIKVTGVTYSYGGENDVMGASIVVQRSLVCTAAPMCFTTPHKPSAAYTEGGDDSNCLSGECVDALDVLALEAEKYVKGYRAQTELELGDATGEG